MTRRHSGGSTARTAPQSLLLLLAGVVSVLLVPVVGKAAAAPLPLPGICQSASSGELSAVRAGVVCPGGGKRVRIAGANIFDTLWVSSSGMHTCCNSSGGPAHYPDALAALSSASKGGIRVFRFFASLFGDANKLWVVNPALYWSEFDRAMDGFERLGLYSIPSIGTGFWHQVANAVTPGLNESKNDGIINASSVSFGLQAKYFGELVSRYKGRKAVLFWELGNELNLGANLPPPWCGPTAQTGTQQCFNTAQMVAHTTALVQIIRDIDPARPISSGFSAGRSSEWHQEHCPFTGGLGPPEGACATQGGGSGYWGTDTREQWLSMMVKQNTAVDIISIHHYEDTKNCWFDKGNCTNGFQSPGGDLVQFAAAKAASVGKAVYVGEYGGAGPDFTGPSRADQSFPSAMLEYQIGAGDVFPLSTIWAWSCPSHRKDMVCIWPNSTRSKELGSNRMLSDINNANAKMAVEVSLTASAAIIDETSTQSAMALVNGYFQANTPVANNDWTGGTYMAGNLAHYRVSSNQSLLEYAINWGTQHKWALAGYRGCHGTTGCPDNIIAGQSFYEIYELRKQSYMIAGLLAALDAALQRPCQIATNYSQARDGDACWYWVDALFMALPTYARVGAALSNSSIESAERIWDGARAQYNITVSGVNASGGDAFNLWDAHERLFWRDDSFVGRKSGNGHGIFWSRGNGWAFAAMARTLEVLPLSRASDRAEYSSKLVSMAAKLVTLQGADGCWRSSLEDAAQFPAIETTGTSLFVFGLAWGVNNDVLKPSYRSAAIKGWACLNRPWPTGAVRSDGRLGWCQPGGAAPAGNFNATTTSDFCVGSFLLAGSEIAKLARKQ